jgi:DNA-binding transcriptional regulator YhcF (GntR family)
MNNQNEKLTFPKGKLTTFRPLPDAVFSSSELTPLQKLIMADIISFQMNGKRYYKSSTKLADELSVSKRTIQTNFQQLEKNRIISTKLVHTAGMMSKRYAELIHLNRWLTGKKEKINAENEVITSTTNEENDDELKINTESDILEKKEFKDVAVEDELRTNVFDSAVMLTDFRLKKLDEFCSSTKAMEQFKKKYESEYTKEQILEMLGKNDADALKLFHFVFGYDTSTEMFDYGWYDEEDISIICFENEHGIRTTNASGGQVRLEKLNESDLVEQTLLVDVETLKYYLKVHNKGLHHLDAGSIDTINSWKVLGY